MNLVTLGHRGHKYPLMSYSSDFKEAPESVCPSTAETPSCHSRSSTAAASEAPSPMSPVDFHCVVDEPLRHPAKSESAVCDRDTHSISVAF